MEDVKKSLNFDPDNNGNNQLQKPKDVLPQSNTGEKKPLLSYDPYLRTMEQDIQKIKEGKKIRTAPPPAELPTEETKVSKSKTSFSDFSETQKEKDQTQTKSISGTKPDSKFPPRVDSVPMPKAKKTEEETKKEESVISKSDLEKKADQLRQEKSTPSPTPSPTPPSTSPPTPPKPDYKAKSKPETETRSKSSYFRLIVISVGILVIVIGAGGFFYWWNYLKVTPVHYECQNNKCVSVEGEGENRCSLDKDCQPKEPTKPSAYLSFNKTINLNVPKNDLGLLPSLVNNINKKSQTNKTLDRILVKVLFSNGNYYLSLDKLISILDITIPQNISQNFAKTENKGGGYNLFYYNQGDSIRLGLLIKLKQGFAENQLKNWEKQMTEGLKPLLLSQQEKKSATETFQDNVYKNIAIRYINFPTSDLSIDYTVVGDKLLITTSKNSMFKVIDFLVE